jgi:hypothetical protein
MAVINLRQDKERPLTIEEVDSNFDSLNKELAEKLNTEAFNAENILLILDGETGAGSGLDSDKIQGFFPNKASLPNTVAVRDALSNLYANQFFGTHIGAVLGNVTGNLTGTVTGNATNVDGVVQVEHGGTGAIAPAAARTNLGLGSMAVQNSNSVTVTGGTITGITDITLEDGGTGASTASGARSNLGLVIGADIQAYAAILSGISGTTGDGFVIRTSTNAAVTRSFVPGNSIEITNPNGKDGNITVGLTLNPTVSAITKTGTNGQGNIGQADNRFGNAHLQSLGVGTGASGTAGEIRATNNVTAYYSDDRLKTRLGKLENALDKIDQLSGFFYEANEIAQELGYEVKREVGLSAQDTQRILPEVVAPAPIDDKYLTIRYERLAPLFVEGIKELRAELRSIKKHLGMEE